MWQATKIFEEKSEIRRNKMFQNWIQRNIDVHTVTKASPVTKEKLTLIVGKVTMNHPPR